MKLKSFGQNGPELNEKKNEERNFFFFFDFKVGKMEEK